MLHADLYRLKDARELDALAIQEHIPHIALSLIEWPQLIVDELEHYVSIELKHNGSDNYCRTIVASLAG